MKPFFYYSPGGDELATGTATDAGTQKDNSKLVISGPISISPDGGETDEAFPKPNVPYDFVAYVVNTGAQKSDSFFVKFKFDPESANPNPDAELTFKQDAGLDSNADVQAVVHFGSFPNTFNTYDLEACVYAASAPDDPINCTSYGITINTED